VTAINNAAPLSQMLNNAFGKFDRDGDGLVSQDEMNSTGVLMLADLSRSIGDRSCDLAQGRRRQVLMARGSDCFVAAPLLFSAMATLEDRPLWR